MKAASICVILVMALAVPALAAPGDPRVIQGTVEWPQTLAQQPFLVVRGDDGALYYANVSSAERRGAPVAGMTIAVLGVEGAHSNEIVAMLVTPSTDGSTAGASPAGTPAPTPTPAPAAAGPSPAAPPVQAAVPLTTGVEPGPAAVEVVTAGSASPRWTEVSGVVQALAARTLVLKTDNGQRIIVDVSALSPGLAESTPIGSVVKVYGVAGEQRFNATGFIQNH